MRILVLGTHKIVEGIGFVGGRKTLTHGYMLDMRIGKSTYIELQKN